MTTIVYKDGIMAADTLVQTNGISGHSKKIKKVNNTLFGIAGEISVFDDVIKWWFDTKTLESFPSYIKGFETSVLIVPPNRKISIVVCDKPVILNFTEKIWAIGSGDHLAFGALAMGASAKEAVKVSIKYDSYSGGKVMEIGFDK